MDQRFEGVPKAEIRLEGRRLVRSDVSNDWGSQLIWEIRRNGDVAATISARANDSHELTDSTPGQYEVVLRMFQYEGYAKDANGKYTQSKFIDVSNKLTWTA
ncbi:MAG: hypothetical protein JSS49_07640 [Planctomycetes bacterium]|nr:hypothetical protein [Planctomycetota bacterium]